MTTKWKPYTHPRLYLSIEPVLILSWRRQRYGYGWLTGRPSFVSHDLMWITHRADARESGYQVNNNPESMTIWKAYNV